MKNSLLLNINTHCIEATAKNKFKRRMDSYFNEENPEKAAQLELELEILREFIEESDFPALRASDERLSGEIPSRALLERDADNKIHLKILDD